MLSSPLSELTGFCLSVDCLTPGCRGERAFAIGDLALIYGPAVTVGDVLRRMKCGFGCDAAVGAAWLTTGPVLSTRVRLDGCRCKGRRQRNRGHSRATLPAIA